MAGLAKGLSMSCRCFASSDGQGARVTLMLILSLVLLSGVVWAQTAESESSRSPRTSWGDPDLGGIWNNSTLTPLERPETQADQEFLSPDEAAALEQQAVDRNNRANEPSVVRTEPLPAGGNVGGYNNFWMDRGTTVIPTRRTSLIMDPPDGRLPSLTPDAQRLITSSEMQLLDDVRQGRLPIDSYDQLDLGDRCIWYRGIPSFPTGYNNNYHIMQTPNVVAILQEHIHDVRFIPLDGRPHVDQTIRQYGGDSRGYWEGDTLTIETSNFSDRAFIRRFNLDLTEALHVVERFTRIGPDTLDYYFTVEDRNIWTRPWKGTLPMVRSGGPMFEYACHEGNYGMTNILAGSRALERSAQ